jgi:cytochrome c oxidase subunit 2
MDGGRDSSSGLVACSFLAGGVLPLFSAQSALADDTSVFSPTSPQADYIRSLFILVLAISGVIFVIVEGMLVYSVIRFRYRKGQEEEPPQFYGSLPIEMAWTVGPLLVVFVLFLVVFRQVMEIRPTGPPEGAVSVQVIGHQWWWEFRYPRLDVTTANELHIPVSTPEHRQPIYLELTSADVIHSFWVPRLAGKTDCIPGQINTATIEPRETGVFMGHCAEFCGTQHANMMIRVFVEPDDRFQQWLSHQRRPAVDDPGADRARGLFMSMPCMNCHTIDGTAAVGTVGPVLTHLMSRETLAAGVVPNTRENLTEWVADPQKVKPGCRMPDMHLDQQEVSEIVSYLETLE